MKKPKPDLTPEAVTERFRALTEKYHARDKVTIDEVKRRIYEAGDVHFQKTFPEYYEWAIGLFSEAKSADEMNEVMKLCSDAWNVFPHKDLGGKSPVDMLSGHEKARMTKASENVEEVFAESIKNLYAITLTRAKREFKRIGGSPQEFVALESSLGEKGMERHSMLRSLFAIGKRMHYTGTEWFEPFAREYQAMANHQILPGKDDFIGSPFLFEVLQTSPELRQSPVTVFSMIDYTLNTHEMIEAYGKKRKLDIRMISIAHHTFDWLMMIQAADMMMDIPETTALCVYAIMARIQKAMGDAEHTIPENVLTEHIYPDERILFSNRITELLPILLCAVEDPHMLIVTAEGVPDDWFARMKYLAPDMQDHFGEKPPDGSVPSPFYPYL